MSYFKNSAILALVLAMPLGLARGSEEQGHHGQDESSANGIPGDMNKPSRLVAVSMREGDGKMLFVPDAVTVAKGEQIHFQLRNDGELEHEFVLGTAEEFAEHAEKMKAPDTMHRGPNAVLLGPKASGDLVWKFTTPGDFEFACLIPGHLEAGMKGKVVVK
ncbi:MAG: cupredoxin family protein [Hyphomicrobium sp.]|uniref:cupredoxin domain-containing protein n=1 Tax=Hyphomicrobium sp. TaxID=82 RepID=UPI00132372BF|nr:cupredoxin family protein [Hyphomicrobium sp.]KAB2943596.1 MAG: cupredoxin family protein [Hyphomicrobium sp.]MBZ0209672.1 cupredoxin family protein [Hyphomicrobium sp.]